MAYAKPPRSALVTLAGLLLMPIHGRAQEERQQHTCTIDAAYSFAFPQGEDGHNFENARWGILAGGGFAVRRLAEPGHGNDYFITANFMYEKFKATPSALYKAQTTQTVSPNPLSTATSAHGSFSAVTLDPTVRFFKTRRGNAYLSGGFGWFRRGVSFNGANPGTLIQANGVSLDRLHAASGVFDGGGGVNFRLWKNGTMLFIEGRVYRGLAVNGGSTLIPVSLGIRW